MGDGDCGDTLLAGARAVLGDLGGYPTHDAAAAVAAVARSVRQSMGGSSGALYDLGFTAAARALKVSAWWSLGICSDAAAGPSYGAYQISVLPPVLFVSWDVRSPVGWSRRVDRARKVSRAGGCVPFQA